MKKISRNIFLQQSLQIGTGLLLSHLTSPLLANIPGTTTSNLVSYDRVLLQRLVDANDKQVARFLESDLGKIGFSRRVGYEFAALAASYCCQQSTFFHHASLVAALEKLAQLISNVQAEDGTVNLGNLESPPDTAFLLEQVTAGAYLLSKDNTKELANVKATIRNFILKAGDALVSGGVHTPNHRWVICAALAQINELYPAKKYVARIEDWLGEGIFIDSDGHYPERSMNYAYVENYSLLTIGRLLNKPSLFDPVRNNLDMVYYYMEPDGELVTTDSRRQDQYSSRTIVSWYWHYRYLAIQDSNKKFAAIARLIENMKGFEEEVIGRSLFYFLANPLLQNELPADAVLSNSFEKLFSTSHLLRIRRDKQTTTFFGGVDWPLTIASGRSNSPNFYSFRKGDAVLKYLRLSSSFFSTGYFYSEGLKKTGNKYVLYKKLEVPYYQPLPKQFRNAKGDYKLSPSTDGRFWNKMDFERRPLSNIKTLETKVSLQEINGANELTFEVWGQKGVSVTIELCFKEGGTLSGATAADGDNSFLEKGMAQYRFGDDAIQFGPGTNSHRSISGLEGERYSTHFGTLRTPGMRVYLTGVTPFKHQLIFS